MSEEDNAIGRLYDYIEAEYGYSSKHLSPAELIDDLINSHKRLVEELRPLREKRIMADNELRKSIMEKYIKDNEFISLEKLNSMTIEELVDLLKSD